MKKNEKPVSETSSAAQPKQNLFIVGKDVFEVNIELNYQ